MPESPLTPELAAAVAAVRAGCQVARGVAKGQAGVNPIAKSDNSPVTVADFAVQAVVIALLRQRLGPIAIIGEESTSLLHHDSALLGAVVAAAKLGWPEATQESVLAAIDQGNLDASPSTYWALDPIDGTKGFVRGGQYAVCLARIEHGSARLGVLGCPNLPRDIQRALDERADVGVVYATGPGAPCYESDTKGAVFSPLPTTAGKLPDELVIAHSVESGHSRMDQVVKVMGKLGRPFRTIACDSQAKYALVARGQAHAYIRIPTQPNRVELVWDHSAGAVIAAHAGMVVTDLRGAAFDFSSPQGMAENYGILCAHPAIHQPLVEALQDELDAAGSSTDPHQGER